MVASSGAPEAGGAGIHSAMQDAVVVSNLRTRPLREGRLRLRDLAADQRRREIPTRVIQAFQRIAQEQIVAWALVSDAPLQAPPVMRLSILRDLVPRMLALGVWPVRLETHAAE